MKAAILTIASTRTYDNHADALFVLESQQKSKVLEAIQNLGLSDNGMLIVIEGYASIQRTGSDQIILVADIIRAEALGNPSTELLNREVIYFGGRGILGLRVVYTRNPLKRIVYDITGDGEIREAHV